MPVPGRNISRTMASKTDAMTVKRERKSEGESIRGSSSACFPERVRGVEIVAQPILASNSLDSHCVEGRFAPARARPIASLRVWPYIGFMPERDPPIRSPFDVSSRNIRP